VILSVSGVVIISLAIGIIIFIVVKRKKRKNEKKRMNEQQLNENNSMIQQKKRETVVIESDMNTITSFDETKTNTTTLSTYQPSIHSSQKNKQTHSIFFTHI
jgi:predicted histidine transporter YuiF (NhaC family)